MPPLDAHTPHKALLALHQMVDNGISPLLAPMQLDWATESVVTVDASDLAALAAGPDDPHTALVRIEPGPDAHAMLVAEPGLSRTVLARIWRSRRNERAPLTQVENEILRQFIANLCAMWKQSWKLEGIEALPHLAMGTTLSMLRAQMHDGPWYVARTLVRDGEQPVGVLLFCYPAALLPTLIEARRNTLWRTRIEKGLAESERVRLHNKLSTTLRDVRFRAPVTLRTDVPLHMLNELERGDVISLDAPLGGELQVAVLDRQVSGQVARTPDNNFALVVTGPQPEAAAPVAGDEQHFGAAPGGDDAFAGQGFSDDDHPFSQQ